ncbi:MAG: hypothetical protein Q8N59_02080 [bacterium]|nr:hypothetical protein [bacterium]
MKKKPKKGKKLLKKGGAKKRKAVKKLKFKALKRKPKKIAKKKKAIKPKKKIRRVKKISKKPKKIVKKSKIRKARKSRKSSKIKALKPRVYIGKGLLEQLFESQPKVKVLKFFFRNFQDVFTLKQIFRRLRTNVSLVRREIGKLERLGLIKQKKVWLIFKKKRGGTRKEQKLVYCINTDFDFFNELKNLILKSTISSKEELINNVKKIGNIKILALSGIFTGDETAKADILIVGDKINSRKLNTFLKDLEAEAGKELNCSAMSTREFNYRYDMYDRFVRDLLTGKSEVLINRINLW